MLAQKSFAFLYFDCSGVTVFFGAPPNAFLGAAGALGLDGANWMPAGFAGAGVGFAAGLAPPPNENGDDFAGAGEVVPVLVRRRRQTGREADAGAREAGGHPVRAVQTQGARRAQEGVRRRAEEDGHARAVEVQEREGFLGEQEEVNLVGRLVSWFGASAVSARSWRRLRVGRRSERSRQYFLHNNHARIAAAPSPSVNQ